MNVIIRDADAMRALLPEDVAQYLEATRWKQTALQPGRASIWERCVGGEEFEILLLLDRAIGDYALRMGELVTTLAVVEKRSQLEVYYDLIPPDETRVVSKHDK